MTSSNQERGYSLMLYLGIELLLGMVCILEPSKAASAVSLVVFLGGLGAALIKNPNIIPRGLAIMFALVANIIGVAVVEFQNVYLGELRCYSYFAGSLPLIELAWWTFFTVFCLLSNKVLSKGVLGTRLFEKDEVGNRVKRTLNLVNVAIAIVYAAMFVHVFNHPSFLLGFDRFQYSIYLTGVWGKLNSVMIYTYPLICLCIIWASKRIGAVTLSIVLLYLVWTGNKFGPFLTLASVFLFAWYPLLIVRLKRIKPARMLGCSVAAMAAIVLLAVGQYSLTNGFENAEQSTTYLSQRAAQQGQLWWKTYDLCKNGTVSESIESEIPVWLSGKDDSELNYDYGIYKIMRLTTPADLFAAKIDSGSRYSEAGHAAAYLYGGPLGLIAFDVVMGALIAVVVSTLIRSLANAWIIETLVLFRLLQILMTSLSMFTFNNLFSPASICTYAVLLISLMARMNKRKQSSVSCVEASRIQDSAW